MDAALIFVSLIFIAWAASPARFLIFGGADRNQAEAIERDAMSGQKRSLLHLLIVGRYVICWIGTMLLTVAVFV